MGRHLPVRQLKWGEMDPTQAAHTSLIAVTKDLADIGMFKPALLGGQRGVGRRAGESA